MRTSKATNDAAVQREVERVGPEGNPRWSRTRGDNCSSGWREVQARRQSCHWLSHIVVVCACVCVRVLPGLIVVCNCALCVALSLLLLLLCSWCCCWCWVMAASNQLINIAWDPQWKRLKNNALRDAKWFNNANETRGETKAAQNTLHLSPATPPFSVSVVSLLFIASWQLLLGIRYQRTPAFHFHHVTSMQIKVMFATTLRIRNVPPKSNCTTLYKTYAQFTWQCTGWSTSSLVFLSFCLYPHRRLHCATASC